MREVAARLERLADVALPLLRHEGRAGRRAARPGARPVRRPVPRPTTGSPTSVPSPARTVDCSPSTRGPSRCCSATPPPGSNAVAIGESALLDRLHRGRDRGHRRGRDVQRAARAQLRLVGVPVGARPGAAGSRAGARHRAARSARSLPTRSRSPRRSSGRWPTTAARSSTSARSVCSSPVSEARSRVRRDGAAAAASEPGARTSMRACQPTPSSADPRARPGSRPAPSVRCAPASRSSRPGARRSTPRSPRASPRRSPSRCSPASAAAASCCTRRRDGEPEVLDFFVAVPGLDGADAQPHVSTVVVDFAKAGPAATASEQVFHGGWGTVAVPGQPRRLPRRAPALGAPRRSPTSWRPPPRSRARACSSPRCSVASSPWSPSCCCSPTRAARSSSRSSRPVATATRRTPTCSRPSAAGALHGADRRVVRRPAARGLRGPRRPAHRPRPREFAPVLRAPRTTERGAASRV